MNKVGIIGAGTMGREVAATFAGKKYEVILVDHSTAMLNDAKEAIKEILRFAQIFSKKAFCNNAANYISYTTDFNRLGDVDIIIENVTEKIEIKKEVYQLLSEICKPNTIFCVNTSCVPITKIASFTKRESFVIGIHFMNPVTRIQAAEVILGYHTSEKTLEAVKGILNQLEIESIVVGDFPGFVSNRISHLMMNEAAFIVQEGYAQVEDIDNIFKKCYGHKMGPLETADLIGIDVVVDSLQVLYESYQDPKFRVCPLLIKMADAGLKGKKTGKGFYVYE